MEQNIRIKETANRRLLDVNAAFICLYSTHFIPSKLPPRVWWARQYCTQNNNRNPAMWLLEETCVQKSWVWISAPVLLDGYFSHKFVVKWFVLFENELKTGPGLSIFIIPHHYLVNMIKSNASFCLNFQTKVQLLGMWKLSIWYQVPGFELKTFPSVTTRPELQHQY